MSLAHVLRRSLPTLKTTLLVIVALAINLLLRISGFDHWLRSMPTTFEVVRILVVLIFGGLGLLALLTPRRHLGGDWLFFRICGALFLGIALYHGAMLVTGAPIPSNPFVTE